LPDSEFVLSVAEEIQELARKNLETKGQE